MAYKIFKYKLSNGEKKKGVVKLTTPDNKEKGENKNDK